MNSSILSTLNKKIYYYKIFGKIKDSKNNRLSFYRIDRNISLNICKLYFYDFTHNLQIKTVVNLYLLS